MKKPVTSLTHCSPSSLCPLIISGLCSSHYLAPASSHITASMSPSPTFSFFPAFHCHWGKVQITRCHQGHLPGSGSSGSCLGLLAHLRLLSLRLQWWFCEGLVLCLVQLHCGLSAFQTRKTKLILFRYTLLRHYLELLPPVTQCGSGPASGCWSCLCDHMRAEHPSKGGEGAGSCGTCRHVLPAPRLCDFG